MKITNNLLVQHFGFTEAPFPLTTNVRAFFEGGNRLAVLEALRYSILNGEGIITVTGEVGSGKTMLSRMLAESEDPTFEFIYLGHPRLRTDELAAVLATELGVEIRFKRRSQIMTDLYQRLLELHEQGKRVVLIVDEAHVMPAEALEEVRLITNLDTSRHKLLQVVLFGQQELNQILATNVMRPLRERITERFELKPLTPRDVGLYIAHRLRKAGSIPEVIDARAAAYIARRSKGLPRRVNILCEKSLLAAYTLGSTHVTLEHAQMAGREVPFQSLKPTFFYTIGLRWQSLREWLAEHFLWLHSRSTQDKPAS